MSSSSSSRVFKSVVTSSVSSSDFYRLLTSMVVPRPIALVTSLNEDASVNCAPFSFFNALSSNPATLCVSVTSMARPQRPDKDTLLNVLRTKEFVVHASQMHTAALVNWCSAELPHGESELQSNPTDVRVSLVPSTHVAVPRIEQCGWALECKLHSTVQLGERGAVGATTLLIGQILVAHIQEDLLDAKGHIDAKKLQPLARLGGPQYSAIGEVFSLDRPKIAKKN